jgi:hypothetical protein
MSYGVVWSENGGPLHAGRLDLARSSVLLDGTAQEVRRSCEQVSYDELGDVRVEQRPDARLGGRPTLVLERRNGSRLRVASVEGGGALHELADLLQLAWLLATA